jgi:hypothetical protein
MTDAPNTVVILGTGATRGSGYTRCGKSLPGDQGFFCNPCVQSLLENKKYPALHLMLGTFRNMYGDNLANVSLEEVWTFLEFSANDIYKPLTDLTGERERWLEIIRKQDSRTDEHCLCQYYRVNCAIPPQTEIDLHLLAGWDLRRLLCRVYGEVASSERNFYEMLIEKYKLAKDSSTTFISLNYDTILEKELTRASLPWHYLHVQTGEPRNEIRILKPHGSFNWLFKGNESPVSISTDYRLNPVTHRSFTENRFEEAMIIPPTQLKPEINIKETQRPETTDLFSNIWRSMADALVGASRVFIIGYSFPSTDHHLRTLLYQVRHKRDSEKKPAKYDEVYCCTMANGGQEGLVLANASRFFPADCFHPHDRGFEDFVSSKQG